MTTTFAPGRALEDQVAAKGAAVMDLLGRGIPLTLLIDLADPAGPDSAHILATERRDCA